MAELPIDRAGRTEIEQVTQILSTWRRVGDAWERREVDLVLLTLQWQPGDDAALVTLWREQEPDQERRRLGEYPILLRTTDDLIEMARLLARYGSALASHDHGAFDDALLRADLQFGYVTSRGEELLPYRAPDGGVAWRQVE